MVDLYRLSWWGGKSERLKDELDLAGVWLDLLKSLWNDFKFDPVQVFDELMKLANRQKRLKIARIGLTS